MQSSQQPVFRDIIVPWYDSDTACMALVFLLIFVALFGVVGIFTALGNPLFNRHVWIPTLMVVLSLTVIGSVVFRVSKRNARISRKSDSADG